MRTFAILPMKVPGEGKTRLEGTLSRSARSLLAEAMFLDTVEAAGRSALIDETLVVTPDGALAAARGALGTTWVPDPGVASHSEAASLGITAAVLAGADRALLLPGDCPGLQAADLDGLLSQPFGSPTVAVVPDRHGTGTNALLLQPPTAITPAFGPGSHRRHLDLAAAVGALGVTADVRSLALDIDTPDDLEAARIVAGSDPAALGDISASALRELGLLADV